VRRRGRAWLGGDPKSRRQRAPAPPEKRPSLAPNGVGITNRRSKLPARGGPDFLLSRTVGAQTKRPTKLASAASSTDPRAIRSAQLLVLLEGANAVLGGLAEGLSSSVGFCVSYGCCDKIDAYQMCGDRDPD